jgi:rare lipoprotein A (peptidoglycan hydrolase)
LRSRPSSRAAVTAGALILVSASTAAAEPAAAQTNAKIAGVGVAKKRLHVRAGNRVAVVGSVRPGTRGLTARLQIRRRGRWATIDRDRTAGSGRYVLRDRRRHPMSARARVRVRDARHPVGRVNVYRWSYASWYGPGLYGNPLGCGGTLWPGRLGVAHKSLPCGSKVWLRHRGRTVRVRVIDRGPYVGGREYDLTEATAQRLRFRGHGPILTTR